jgi:hypothetical protein
MIEFVTEAFCNRVEWTSTQEALLAPQQKIEFQLPANYQSRTLDYIVLEHRQDPSSPQNAAHLRTGIKHDPEPGLTSIQVRGTSTKQWYFWGGDSSGQAGAKYAEIRGYPEIERLYEWLKNGYYSVVGEDYFDGPLSIDRLQAVSLGTDSVLISKIAAGFIPARPTHQIEKIYSTGTQMGDPETQHGRALGGGQRFRGQIGRASV